MCQTHPVLPGDRAPDRGRILIAANDRSFCERLRASIEAHEALETIGIAESADDAIHLVETLKPSVVLMDVALDGIEATRKMREFSDGPAVVLMASEDEEIDDRAVEAGAAAYVRKGTDLLALVDVVAAFAGLDGQAKPKDHPID